jgi:uncharacterized protein
MSIDLTSFLDRIVSNLHLEESLKIENINVNGRKIDFTEPVKFTGDIYKVDEDNFLSGNIHFKYKENCARCLKEFVQEINTAISGKLIEGSKKIKETDEDEEDLKIYYEGNNIDLTESVVSAIILSLPMKSLCKEDCKGLCPKCGKNLNEGKCDCVEDYIDPRLAKLKEFLQ